MSTTQDPLFGLKRDYKPSELEKQKFSEQFNDGRTKKVSIPKWDGESTEALFYCLSEFKAARFCGTSTATTCS